MIPTARGKSLYDQVFESIDRLEQVSRGILKHTDAKTLDRPQTPMRLGASPDYFDVFVLPHLKASDLACQVTFGEPRELHAMLQSGMLDAVIAVAKPSVRALQYRILAEKRYVLIGPPSLKPKTVVPQRQPLSESGSRISIGWATVSNYRTRVDFGNKSWGCAWRPS